MPYIPRLITAGIQGNPYWYSNRNIYYADGWQLPEMTNYCYGRWWECSDLNKHFENKPAFDIRAAYRWYAHTADGYQRSQTPQLGAIACFDYANHNIANGLLAVVEEITNDPVMGQVAICCNGRPDDDDQTRLQQWYIQLPTNEILDVYPYDWEDATFQGYIINPITGGSLDPPTIPFKPWMAKRILYRRKNDE